MVSWQIIILLGIIAGIVLLAKVKTPKFIGSIGESDLRYKLNRLDAEHYASLHDILVPTHGGKTATTQIDHLVVSTYGLFCIETKTLSGSISGSAHDKTWTQTLPNKSFDVYNPLRQNYGHIKALEGIIGRRLKSPIVSLVAFPIADSLDISGTDAVADVKGTIDKLLRYQVPLYSKEERRVIIQLVEASRIRDRSAYRAHIRDVRAHRS